MFSSFFGVVVSSVLVFYCFWVKWHIFLGHMYGEMLNSCSCKCSGELGTGQRFFSDTKMTTERCTVLVSMVSGYVGDVFFLILLVRCRTQ